MSAGNHWGALFSLVAPHKIRLAVIIVLLTVIGLLPLAGPLLVASFIDQATIGAPTSTLVGLAGIYVGLGVVRQVLAVVAAWNTTDLAWRSANELRSRLAAHVLNLDLSFHRGTSPGELVSRVDGDVTALSDFVSSFAAKAASAVVTMVGLVLVVAWRNVAVGFGFAVYIAVAIFAVFQLRDMAVDEAASGQAAAGKLLGEVEERLAGADDLRANGGGSHAVARFQHASALTLWSELQRERKSVALWILSNVVFVIGGIVVLAFDAVLLRRGVITIGTAFLIFQYTQVLRDPLAQLAEETERVQRAAGGMVRTLQLLGAKSAIVDDGNSTMPPGPLGVEFESVGFVYPDDDDQSPVLHDLSVHLEPGRTLGVLGRTGSGKTTVARLVLRLLDPTEGIIKVGGVPLTDMPIDHLRSRTGVITQDVHLFAASIRDNITLFDETVSDSSVKAALNELGLADWVEAMAEGLDTELGPEGVGLSAGERQLIALTRLFLRSPDLVVLDEASSRVDPVTEERIGHAIERLLGGRTAIVIAHRLSTVDRLDEILVLDKGRVVEWGPVEKLRADPASHYTRLRSIDGDTDGDLDAADFSIEEALS